MPDLTVDGLIGEITGLLVAMTESEALLLARLRTASLGRQAEPVDVSTPSTPRDIPASIHEASPPVAHTAPAMVAEQDQDPWSEVSPIRNEVWPDPSAERPLITSAKRSYDFFAELDEKLAILQGESKTGGR